MKKYPQRVGSLLLSLLLAAIVSNALPLAGFAGSTDFDITGGHFYTQAAGATAQPGSGYAITDEGKDTRGQTIKFWSEFQRLGGVAALGYPASSRFEWNGFTSQVTQRFVLQWRPELNRAVFVNVMDQVTALGKDDYLKNARQTPLPYNFKPEEQGLSFQQIVEKRYKLLDAYPAIKAKYFAVSDPLNLYGLPTAPITDMGDAYVLRAQRVIIQQWKKDVAWAKAGSITIALGGDIAKEIGLIAAVAPQAVVPQPSAPATINVSVPKAPPAPPSNSTKQAPGAQQCPNALFVIPSNGTLGTTYRQPGGGEAGFSDVHTGIDILGTTDDDVYAAYDGVVDYLSYPRVSIWHADLGVETYYTHMSVITVKPGQKVQRGEVIGKKGAVNTGGIVLLHFSVKKRSIDERYLANTFDPSPYLKANVNYTTGARQFLRPVMGWCN